MDHFPSLGRNIVDMNEYNAKFIRNSGICKYLLVI